MTPADKLANLKVLIIKTCAQAGYNIASDAITAAVGADGKVHVSLVASQPKN